MRCTSYKQILRCRRYKYFCSFWTNTFGLIKYSDINHSGGQIITLALSNWALKQLHVTTSRNSAMSPHFLSSHISLVNVMIPKMDLSRRKLLSNWANYSIALFSSAFCICVNNGKLNWIHIWPYYQDDGYYHSENHAV